MHSDKPKVLQLLLEEPVLYYILDSVRKAGFKNVAVLVGHRGDMVEAYLRQEWPDVGIVWQKEQLGTGHAVKVAQDWWGAYKNVMVLNGDVPLVRPETLVRLSEMHVRRGAQCSLVSVNIDDPTGYGRIVRLADGGVRIVEQKEAIEDELEIHEINAGVYIFETKALATVAEQLTTNNEQHEYYITDAVHLIGDTEGEVSIMMEDDESELRGVNTPYDLAVTGRTLKRRIMRELMIGGLKCVDPRTTWIGPRVSFDEDVTVEPGVQIWGRCTIGARTNIGAHSTIRNSRIGSDCMIWGPCVIADSELEDGVEAGPFAFLRQGALMKERARAGRFVEIKNSSIGEDAKVPHLSYIGDAQVGNGTNIGAGTITCNYDGELKHRTVIGDGCFIGSDTMFVAPVEIGDGAATAAGSVITEDVPAHSLGVARSRQSNVEGWSATRRSGGGKES